MNTASAPTHAGISLGATLSYGFRPFFALAACAALLLPAAWLAVLAGWRWPGAPSDLLAWHGHEMLYGFVGAAVAGFVLTAVPSFTQRPPLTGAPLAVLVAAWLMARLAAVFGGVLSPAVVAGLDVGFVALLAVVVGRDILRAGNRRNLVLIALLVAFGLAALAEHTDLVARPAVPGLHVVLLLLGVFGGRIVPAFTGNWLRARGEPNMPARRAWLDRTALLLTLAAGLADTLGAAMATALLALLAGLAHGLRLAGWRGLAARAEPMLLVLHGGYAWLVAGYLLLAAAAAGMLPREAALHAFAMGAMGTMILGVMTRASLGHTGRPLVAPVTARLAWGLVTLAALARVAAALWPAAWGWLVPAAGGAWMAAFACFLAGFLPMLVTPRLPELRGHDT